MTKRNAEYYLLKARVERERATTLTDPDTAAVHHELARGYETLARADQGGPLLTISNSSNRAP
jgi:hypothetical protein